jgi:hypothetical protein
MGFVTGLAGVREQQDKQPKNEDFADRPKANWVSLKDGESVKITPLQEIDEGSPNFDKDNGLAIFSLQHSNPDNWKKNAECTVDEGDCYGCANGWRQKTVFYINVLVTPKSGSPFVGILSRGLGKGSVAQSLLNMAADEDYDNSITDKTFKFSRTGSTKDDTTYSLDILPSAKKVDVTEYTEQLFDLPKYVFHVNPDKQEAYYLDLKQGQSAPAKEAVPVSAGAVDNDW